MYSRAMTLRKLIHNLQDIVAKDPKAGDAIVLSEHSASGCVEHLNSFHLTSVSEYDVNSEFGFFYEDEGLNIGDKVIKLSVGGN